MPRICDLPLSSVVVGLRVRSLAVPTKIGTIVRIDPIDDCFAWIQWDGDTRPLAGFYGNDCVCEVVS